MVELAAESEEDETQVVTLLFVLLVIGGTLALLNAVLTSFSKTGAQLRHQDRCAFCGARLKTGPTGRGFASHCARCGQRQPWAKP